jgi:hypothetical protein
MTVHSVHCYMFNSFKHEDRCELTLSKPWLHLFSAIAPFLKYMSSPQFVPSAPMLAQSLNFHCRIYYTGFLHPSDIQSPEDGNCIPCRNVGRLSTIDVAYPGKRVQRILFSESKNVIRSFFICHLILPNVEVEWLAFLLRIIEVSVSNIGPKTVFHDQFLWSFQYSHSARW